MAPMHDDPKKFKADSLVSRLAIESINPVLVSLALVVIRLQNSKLLMFIFLRAGISIVSPTMQRA